MRRIAIFIVSLFVLTAFGVVTFLFMGGGIDGNFENEPISVASPMTVDSPLGERILEEETIASPTLSEDAPSPEVVPVPRENAVEEKPAPPASPSSSTIEIIEKSISFGYREPPSPRAVDTVVIHSSYNASGGDVYDIEKVIRQYEDYGVGAHYLIGRQGTIYRLVVEKNIAYHAGQSKMPDGRQNVNDFSIGIELVGTEGSGFTAKQYESLNALLADIKGRYTIRNVVGHSDIAPGRKTDPWEFDWTKLK